MNRSITSGFSAGILSFISLTFFLPLFSQAQMNVLKGGNMENKASWFLYNLGSATPALAEFNYSAQKPAQGANGCLRISSPTPTSVLIWQKIAARAGEVYTVDGAIKTNNVASFWSEVTVGTIPPAEGVDYSPNGGADVIRGFSTWIGCGPNVDGTYNLNACTGKASYTVPGTSGTPVDIYFGVKTGSMANPMPNALEVSIDELKLTRTTNTGNDIIVNALGTIDVANTSLRIPAGIRAAQLKSAIVVLPYAVFKIVNASNVEVSNISVIDNTMKVVVTAENNTTKTYSILANLSAIAVEVLNNVTTTVTGYSNRNIEISGFSNITLTSIDNPLKGSLLNLKSTEIWIYFPGIKPSVVYQKICPQILINGEVAVVDKNVRVDQYLDGTMLISHPVTYQALQLFDGENLTGASMHFNSNTYYRTAQLGALNDAGKSFRLKKGYMATFAQHDNGTLQSKVYVAYDKDIVINKLPAGLHSKISFVKVIPWRWVGKKGWTSGVEPAQILNAYWQYDWDNAASSTLDVEYIPMRHNMNWNNYANINNKIKSTHALGFNEPDRTDQANMTVDQAIAAWPEMLKSGLRLGSPCPSDAGPALDWLYQFVDRCDQLGYRVDFIPVHWYKGGQTAKQFYDWLKAISVRTKRPVWITEWNNGANWTCCKPTFESQATVIGQMINMMDTASFVERYSLYEWVENTRQMFYQSAVSLTPAGVVYRNNTSPLAYNPNKVTSIITGNESQDAEEDQTGSHFKIFPNPVEKLITFQTDLPAQEVLIYTVNGELVKSFYDVKSNSVDIESLPSGMYMIKVSDGNSSWIKKIIKK